MNSLHDSDLKSRLVRFLGRKQMPRRFEGKPSATDDEIAALLRVLVRNAPRAPDSIGRWWAGFEGALGEACGAVWPTEKEVREAAERATKAIPPAALAGKGDSTDMRPIAVTARKMAAGEPVGEDCLWGRTAVEMIAERLVDRGVMDRYRSGAFLKRRALYGEAAALAWEAEAKARHDAAKQVWRSRSEPAAPRDTTAPDISAPYDAAGFAAE